MGEDVLFGWRARRSGARTTFAPDALVHHAVFPGTMLESVRYRWHWRHMPGLAKRVPELRDELFFRRWFYDRRSAEFDLAVVSILAAAVTGRRVALVGALPYTRLLYRAAARWGRRRAVPSATEAVAADATTLAALLAGSVAWRSILL
jgi:hypothetical protein